MLTNTQRTLDCWKIVVVDTEVELLFDQKIKLNKWIALEGRYKNRYLKTSVVINAVEPFLVKTSNCTYFLKNRVQENSILPHGFVKGWEKNIISIIQGGKYASEKYNLCFEDIFNKVVNKSINIPVGDENKEYNFNREMEDRNSAVKESVEEIGSEMGQKEENDGIKFFKKDNNEAQSISNSFRAHSEIKQSGENGMNKSIESKNEEIQNVKNGHSSFVEKKEEKVSLPHKIIAKSDESIFLKEYNETGGDEISNFKDFENTADNFILEKKSQRGRKSKKYKKENKYDSESIRPEKISEVDNLKEVKDTDTGKNGGILGVDNLKEVKDTVTKKNEGISGVKNLKEAKGTETKKNGGISGVNNLKEAKGTDTEKSEEILEISIESDPIKEKKPEIKFHQVKFNMEEFESNILDLMDAEIENSKIHKTKVTSVINEGRKRLKFFDEKNDMIKKDSDADLSLNEQIPNADVQEKDNNLKNKVIISVNVKNEGEAHEENLLSKDSRKIKNQANVEKPVQKNEDDKGSEINLDKSGGDEIRPRDTHFPSRSKKEKSSAVDDNGSAELKGILNDNLNSNPNDDSLAVFTQINYEDYMPIKQISTQNEEEECKDENCGCNSTRSSLQPPTMKDSDIPTKRSSLMTISLKKKKKKTKKFSLTKFK